MLDAGDRLQQNTTGCRVGQIRDEWRQENQSTPNQPSKYATPATEL